MMTWLMLAAGLVLLVFGADYLVKGAARLAGAFGIPSLVIGLTVVAFGTSAPELAVSVKAAWAGQAELAIANVVGSNIFNVLFILGVAAMIMPLVISKQLIRQDVPLMIVASVAVAWMVQDGRLSFIESATLFAGLIAYTVFLFVQGKRQTAAESGDEEVEAMLKEQHPMWQNLLFVVGGLALLVLGARWLVGSAVELATAWGVSEAVIGLTIVAAGTSLPEVMTSIIATIKGERDIAVGNVVGSNIFNILGVLGLSGMISPVPLEAAGQLASLDIPVMLAVAVLCLPLFFIGATLTRFEGLLFLVAYVGYTWLLIALALKHDYLPVLQQSLLQVFVPFLLIYIVVSFFLDRKKQQANG